MPPASRVSEPAKTLPEPDGPERSDDRSRAFGSPDGEETVVRDFRRGPPIPGPVRDGAASSQQAEKADGLPVMPTHSPLGALDRNGRIS